MVNPYESPKTVGGSLEHTRQFPFDVGRFVGRYLQVLAGLSVASMVVELLFFDRLNIDLSCVLFYWAGACLVRHGPTARKWVIGFSGLTVVVACAMAGFALAFGTHGMTVTIGRRIDNPPIQYVLGVFLFVVILAGIPLLLLSRQAREEFARPPWSAKTSSNR